MSPVPGLVVPSCITLSQPLPAGVSYQHAQFPTQSFHRVIVSSQNLWAASERNARIYENAQVFFELIGRDLSSAIACDQQGQEIGF